MPPDKAVCIEFNNWKRKSDMIAVEGYVDGNNNQNGAPRITYDNYKSEARIWPVKGNEIVLNSGLDQRIHAYDPKKPHCRYRVRAGFQRHHGQR